MAKPKKKEFKTTDPLYELFEHYLFNRSFEDSEAFAREIAEDYLSYLDSTPAHVPLHARAHLLKDLENEAHEMLVKKMYGCGPRAQKKDYGKVVEVKKKELKSLELPPVKNLDRERKSE